MKSNKSGMRRWMLALAAGSAVAALAFSPASAQQTPRKLSVQVGVPAPNIVSLQLYVAQQAGFFAEDGVDVEVRYSSGAPQALQLVAASQADVALGTIEPLISGHEKGLRAKAFARIGSRMIYYVAVPADSTVKKVEDLKDAKIGVANLGGAAVAVVRSILREGNAHPNADTLLPVGIGEQAMTALRTNKVQALGLWSNAYYTMERNGHRFRYFHHPTLGDFGNVALMAADKTLTGKRQEMCGFSRAVAKATLFIVENPEAALRMYWNAVPSAKIGATDAEAVKSGMLELMPQIKDLDVGFPPKAKYGVFNNTAVANYETLLKEQGLTATTPPVSELVSDAMIDCMNAFNDAEVRTRAREWKR
jgi:NitT/TauT family transport system substrate-binding protein